VRAGTTLAWGDVAIDETLPAVKIRRDMEALFAAAPAQPFLATRLTRAVSSKA
jgi:hypothetical protein